MRTTNLLDTTTVNFQVLVGNCNSYEVTEYQRDYSWTEEQWDDLWQDIDGLRSDPESRHYMGAIVVKAETDRRFLIIDGQQRIATLTILGLVVIASLEEMAQRGGAEANRQRATALRARFVGEKDPASLTEISKLVLNKHDDGFYQDYLVQLRKPTTPRALSKSNRLLWECFEHFRRRIKSDELLSNDGLKLAELLSEVVARQLTFILITVEDEINAYTVFETLNARGLELTTTDLLKNYLFSRMHNASDLEALQRRWQRLVSTVRQDRFGEFLRYHYLTRFRKIRSGKLFKMVRDEVKEARQVLDLITELESRAELFDALSDPTHGFWQDQPGTRRNVRDLNLFRVRQVIPLLFAAHEKLEPTDFARVLKLVTVISFRYTVVSGLNPSELEQAYSDAAQALLTGKIDSPREVAESLRGIYVSDDKLAADFSQMSVGTSGPRKKVAKYILCRLESEESGREFDFETDPATIEHVLPENPTDGWEESIPRNRWDDAVYRLGNLTLLPASTNRALGAALYPDKLQDYAQSGYAITREIPQIAPEDWTLPLLDHRQAKMARQARHVWRSDFAVDS
jgi:hypothetical protein